VSIGNRIKAARKAAGLSQEELARRADLSLNGFADIEREIIKDPHYSSLRKISDALGVPIGELLEAEPVPLADAPKAGQAKAEDPGAEGVWKAAYERHGVDRLDQWEAEFEQKLEVARTNKPAFFVWLQEIRNFGRSYVGELVSAHTATAGSRLDAVIGMPPIVARYMDLWRRIEDVTEADEDLLWTDEDFRKFRDLVEEGTSLQSLLA
jgi:transcriptional regulator with XRE-family HTH domain